eukprot:GHVN01089675.1.p3 GENE.GHVN01089675.1~~GHVN01089675.1.p3  ORF type:complete len:105 (+),score=13.18 GHVN01089675.1:113-427(+)
MLIETTPQCQGIERTNNLAGGETNVRREPSTGWGTEAADAPPRRLQAAPPAADQPSVNIKIAYQIKLWMTISMVFALVYAVYLVINMSPEKDPLLYTKVMTKTG